MPASVSRLWGGAALDVLLPYPRFCPSCHSKRLEEWGEWTRETLLLDVRHRQVVFTIPKMLRVFFKGCGGARRDFVEKHADFAYNGRSFEKGG
ncbi:MAG: transposase zinc-binding domain-containing protein, partial [Deltaproteobacteria bacterium]|nr:transposase zinc-binding domain-containing protein [Deltaproteobacteria bacterium]